MIGLSARRDFVEPAVGASDISRASRLRRRLARFAGRARAAETGGRRRRSRYDHYVQGTL